MPGSLSYIDILIVAAFIIFIIWWAFRHKNVSDSQSYFLAGKNSRWPIIGFSLFAASVSSSTLMGHSGEGFISGIAVFNYNIIAVYVMVFFAVFFLSFYIKSGIYTIPEFLEKRFDGRSRLYFSIITIIGNIFIDAAATLYTGALILKMIFPEISPLVVIVCLALVAGSYTILGGLSSIINADLIQSIILIIGSMVLAFFCFDSIGGWDSFIQRFHDGVWLHLIRPMNDPTVPWPGVFLGVVILSFYFWGNNQVMVQRVLSAKSVDEGRKGVLFVGFLYLFTLFIFIMPGLVARGIDLFGLGNVLPDQLISGSDLKHLYKINTDEVYPRLILKLLPTGVIGLIIAAMISALTSTLSAILSSVSTLFTMDFYSKMNKNTNSKRLVLVGQIASLIALIIAVIWAPNIQKFDSLVGYYQEMASYIAPPVVGTFLIGIFWKRSNGTGAFYGLISGLALAVFIMVMKYILGFDMNIHYLIFAPVLMLFSMLINILVSYCTAKPSYEKVASNIWTSDIWKDETKALKGVKWYKNFRVLCLILLILCSIEYAIFW
jgi:SSS family solute:Na+ symporter